MLNCSVMLMMCDCSSDEIHLRNKLFEELRDIKSQLKFCTGKTTGKEQPNSSYSDATLSFDIRIDDTLPNIVSESAIFDIRTDTLPQNASEIFDIRVDSLPKRCQTSSVPSNCAEATYCTKRSGIYSIRIPQFSNESFYVECDVKTQGGDWITIQSRQDGSEDFYRNWADYKKGFGDVEGEHFIGLDKLHALTNYLGPQELLIWMENKTYAKYDNFVVGNESEGYALKRIGAYTGTAGNSLRYHMKMKFTTKDVDNDKDGSVNCAVKYSGAWWYKNCYESNLNGDYDKYPTVNGVNWNALDTRKALTYVKMMIRRRKF